LLFEKHLVKIKNDQNGMKPITSFFVKRWMDMVLT
jgi:hypothetical protein